MRGCVKRLVAKGTSRYGHSIIEKILPLALTMMGSGGWKTQN